MSGEFDEVLKRQLEKYGSQLRKFEMSVSGQDESEMPETLADEQLAEFRAGIDANLGPGMADWFLGTYQGPMPDDWLVSLPTDSPVTKDEFIAQHERMRRLLGDLRPTDPNLGVDTESD